MVDLLIPGPEGKIEAKYSHSNDDKSPIVLILHPRSLKRWNYEYQNYFSFI